MIIQTPEKNFSKNLVKFVMDDIYSSGDWKITAVEEEKIVVEKTTEINVDEYSKIETREIIVLGHHYIDYNVKSDGLSYTTIVILTFRDYDQMTEEMGTEFVSKFRNLLEKHTFDRSLIN